MDDDIRLITRAGQRRLAEEDFADIFDFGDGRFTIYFISVYLPRYTHKNLTNYNKCVKKLSTSCVRTAYPKLSASLTRISVLFQGRPNNSDTDL